MSLVINTNVASLNAQRTLNVNSNALAKSLQRLSSGLRINSAADDAAGLAISEGLKSQINGLNQAIRNAGDGLSLLGTAEGAMVEQTNILQRLRELAVQSTSDTNSITNRQSLNGEAAQLKDELDRIARTVDFNGIKLLDGSYTAKTIQVGANATSLDRISIDLQSARSTSLGKAYRATGSTVVSGDGLDAGDVVITVGGISHNVGASAADGVSTASANASALAYATAVNAISNDTNVYATASTSKAFGSAQQAGSTDTDTNYVKINGETIAAVTLDAANDTDLVQAINAKASLTGVTATLGTDDKITLAASDGRNIEVDVAGTAGTTSGLADGTYAGTIELYSSGDFSVTDANTDLHLGAVALDDSNNISTLNLSTKTGALDAIVTVDMALEALNSRRAEIGAQTNRLNSVISNLSVVTENFTASKSRILDADFASETASLTRTQILQQAGVAILAQANQAPQLALSLLK